MDVLFMPGLGRSYSYKTRMESFLYDGETGKLFWSAKQEKELMATVGKGKTNLNEGMPLLLQMGKYHKKFPYIKQK
jgi:hypothetical protein